MDDFLILVAETVSGKDVLFVDLSGKTGSEEMKRIQEHCDAGGTVFITEPGEEDKNFCGSWDLK